VQATTFQKEMAVAKKAAQTAGKTLNSLFGHVNHIVKKGEIDLVTEADLQAESIILEILRGAFPDDNILSEESGSDGHFSNRTWIVDPLDGTTNFAHGFPFYAVSIALEIQSELTLGAVFLPGTNESFEAVKGQGAHLNGKRLRVSGIQTLGEALLGTGFPYDVHENPDEVIGHLKRLLVRAQGIRRPGAAAVDLAYVAAGRLDGFWEQRLQPWDMAAGALLVKEAGGSLSTLNGEPFTPYSDSIVAANPSLHEALLRALDA